MLAVNDTRLRRIREPLLDDRAGIIAKFQISPFLITDSKTEFLSLRCDDMVFHVPVPVLCAVSVGVTACSLVEQTVRTFEIVAVKFLAVHFANDHLGAGASAGRVARSHDIHEDEASHAQRDKDYDDPRVLSDLSNQCHRR